MRTNAVLTVADPRRAATPGTRRSLGRQDFVLRHGLGPFAQGGPLPASETGTTFVPLGTIGRLVACAASTPRRQQIKNHPLAFTVPSLLYHAVQQIWGKSMPCALVRRSIRFGFAGPRGEPDPDAPNRYKGKKPALRKRGQRPRVDALSSTRPDPGAAHAGSCSARRPSAMRRASLSPWRTTAKPTVGLSVRGGRRRRLRLASAFLATDRFGRHTQSL